MPFCASCGTQVEGAFCPKCGAPVGTGAAPPPSGAPPVASAAPMADNAASALCYLLIPAIVFLVIAPYNQNKTVRFNAFQSIFLFVAMVVCSIALGIVLGILHMWFIGFGIHSLYSLACFVLWVYLLITTFQGKTTVLPLIGPLAQQQA
ncbi:MAG TPA: hypothetical protein VGE89_16535 [Bryobacteraceae bacterium]|jgi:uncharacterized membrane protein